MLKVEDYGRIRRAHRDGMSIREIAQTFGHSRRKIREALAQSEPRPYTLSLPRPRRVLSAGHQQWIDATLAADEQSPRKQRHTATHLFRRLRDEEQYVGGYDQVRRYVAAKRGRQRETFLPLSYEPGQRAESDFGQIWVDFSEGRRPVPILLMTWAYSNATFAIALPSEKTEAILHGTVAAFAFFGAVPKELWWDNPKTVATTMLRGRQRELNQRWQALASHYNFEPLFCLPARGNEKPHVENRVKLLERQWATPVPQVKDLTELNAYLLQCCERDVQRTIAGHSETIGARFAAERASAFPVQKDLDAFDFSAVPGLSKPKILELARCGWIEQRHNCCLMGSSGTGKTHLAIALGLAACRLGKRVRFFTAATLVTKLEEAQKQYQLERFLKQLDKLELLVCDELGYLSFNRSGAELLFQVFADRYERASLLITSNLPFSEWQQVFQGERMTAALLDRLTHHCEILEMNGESYRFRESMKQKRTTPKGK